MSFTSLYQIFLYQPLFNALVFLYNVLWSDFGLAVIALTVFIKLALYPLMQKALKSQKVMESLAPRVKELQEKHKNDKQQQGQALMSLYKENNVNPAGGCLPILIQLPILIAMYRVFLTVLDPTKLENVYSFIYKPIQINPFFLGVMDLSRSNMYLAVLTGIIQLVYSKIAQPKKTPSMASGGDKTMDFTKAIGMQMTYVFPVFTVFILLKLPAGLGLYWATMTLFSIFEQLYIKKKYKKND